MMLRRRGVWFYLVQPHQCSKVLDTPIFSTSFSHFRFNTTITNQSSSSIPISIEKLVSQRCKSGSLHLDEALDLFKGLIQKRSFASVIPFNQILTTIAKLKNPHHHKTVISLFKTMNSYGIQPDIYTFNILINSYCLLGRVDLGFVVLGYIHRHGLEPNSATTFNTLLKGLFMEGKTTQALNLFNNILANGCLLDQVTFGVMINGLCKTTNADVALKFMRDLEKQNHLKPDVQMYSVIIDTLCKETR
ncbi:Pentatricopeptide (PPR) repeat protein, partial [Thalictrum thalictroides]